MPILTEELKRKEEVVKRYKIKWGVFKEGTPDYVLEYDREIQEFYERESEGVM